MSLLWKHRTVDGSINNTDILFYSYLVDCLVNFGPGTNKIIQRGEFICQQLNIHPTTLEDSRERLADKGFIAYESKTIIDKNGKKRGVKGSATTYFVLLIDINRLHQRSLKQSLNSSQKQGPNRDVFVSKIEEEMPMEFKPEAGEVRQYFTSYTQVNGELSKRFAKEFIEWHNKKGWPKDMNWEASVERWAGNSIWAPRIEDYKIEQRAQAPFGQKGFVM